MKNLILFLFVITLSTTMHANFGKPSPKSKKQIRAKIVKLLGESDLDFTEEVNATVDLLVNKKGELIVLDVNSNNKLIKDYVTSKLNYKKVIKSLQTEVTLYKMPLKVVTE